LEAFNGVKFSSFGTIKVDVDLPLDPLLPHVSKPRLVNTYFTLSSFVTFIASAIISCSCVVSSLAPTLAYISLPCVDLVGTRTISINRVGIVTIQGVPSLVTLKLNSSIQECCKRCPMTGEA